MLQRDPRRAATTTAAAAGAAAGKVNVEYVSANPTGPMHVGHARGAVFGDALANLLAFAGRDVTREYYINDAGAQVDVLARSAFLRYREALGETIGAIPEGLYPGDYLKPVGEALAAEFGAALRDKPEARMAARRAGARDRGDDGDDPRRSRRARHPHEVFSSERALTGADGGVDRVARGDRRPARPSGLDLRGPAAAAQGRSRPRTGRIASRRCSAPPSSATTSTGR